MHTICEIRRALEDDKENPRFIQTVPRPLSAECKAKTITFDEFHLWPRISPNGEKLASVIRQIDDTEHLVLTDLKTKESSQLSGLAARHPCWLNEENIAFLSPDASTQNTEALVVNISTRET